MHARELVELAALVSAHGPALTRSQQPISAGSIEQYWTASKIRLDRWARCLKDFGQDECHDRRIGIGERAGAIVEEVLTTEILTRVWSAALAAYDRNRGKNSVEPIARSVMIGHMEARHRALTLLVQGRGCDRQAVDTLNDVRRRAERWTDLLLATLIDPDEVSEYAVEPERAREFAEDLQRQGGEPPWTLTVASLRAAFPRTHFTSPNADLNERIASSIVGCFPAEVFNSTGLFRSLWLMRLMAVADDTQGLIDELLQPAGAATRF